MQELKTVHVTESVGAEGELKQIRWAEMIILFYRQCFNRGSGGLYHSGGAVKVCMTLHIVCEQSGQLAANLCFL